MASWRDRAEPVAEAKPTSDWRGRAEPVSDEDEQQAPSRSYGLGETAVIHGAQGVTFGLSDEFAAGMEALTDKLAGGDKDLKKLYRIYLEKKRRELRESAAENPKTAIGSDIGASLGTMLIPGLGVAGNAARAARAIKGGEAAKGLARAAKFGKEFATGTAKSGATGAVAGYGRSEAEDLEGQLDDTATGAKWSAGTYGAVKVGVPVIKAGGRLAGAGIRKGVAAAGGVPDRSVKRYIDRSDQVNKARSFEELGDQVVENKDALKRRLVEGSQSAVDLLPDDGAMEVESVLRKGMALADDMGVSITDSADKGRKDLIRLMERLYAKAKPDVEGGPLKPIPYKEVKQYIKDLDAELRRSESKGDFDTPIHIAKSKLRAMFDDILKKDNPDYAKAMGPVAQDADSLSQLGRIREPGAAGKSLENVARNPPFHVDSKRRFQTLDNSMGTELVDEAEDRLARQDFDKTNVRGFRRAGTGFAAGGGIGGYLTRDPYVAGAMAGIGSVAGFLGDVYGAEWTKKALDIYLLAKRANPTLKVGEFMDYLKMPGSNPYSLGLTGAAIEKLLPGWEGEKP